MLYLHHHAFSLCLGRPIHQSPSALQRPGTDAFSLCPARVQTRPTSSPSKMTTTQKTLSATLQLQTLQMTWFWTPDASDVQLPLVQLPPERLLVMSGRQLPSVQLLSAWTQTQEVEDVQLPSVQLPPERLLERLGRQLPSVQLLSARTQKPQQSPLPLHRRVSMSGGMNSCKLLVNR